MDFALHIVLAQRTVAGGWALALVLAAVRVARRLVAVVDETAGEVGAATPPWWDLPGRAAATVGLVRNRIGSECREWDSRRKSA